MKYTAVITNRDPTLEDAKELFRAGPQTNRADAYSDCRHYAKFYRGFGAVYTDDGESLFEIDWTEN